MADDIICLTSTNSKLCFSIHKGPHDESDRWWEIDNLLEAVTSSWMPYTSEDAHIVLCYKAANWEQVWFDVTAPRTVWQLHIMCWSVNWDYVLTCGKWFESMNKWFMWEYPRAKTSMFISLYKEYQLRWNVLHLLGYWLVGRVAPHV